MNKHPEISCPSCRAAIPPGSPEGLCPACVLVGGMEAESIDADEVLDDGGAPAAGETIGRYDLLQRIGEGGFGIVYMAEQTEPVKRRVALKVIKPGMDSKEVIARFEAERQALALMDHPNIAHIYEAGTTEGGRPYFVMELVKGVPITKYCDEAKLNTNQRLELFADVCSAVQHAHQKGIIHRDLKPSNILVCHHDGKAVPKVIDFGIAKAIAMDLTEKTVFTALGRMIGSPQYVSPEQAELNAMDVDTRSDIYALGVILYELIAGRAPLSDKGLTSVSFDEMRRMIREVEPLKPSAFILNLTDDERRSIAEARGIDGARHRLYVAGDLDWIVMKALEKDRTRRYDTAHGLALDLKRFLKNLPVTAGRPGTAYRVRKFVRRNRGTVAAATAILLALIGGYFWNVHQNAKLIAEKKRTEISGMWRLIEHVQNRQGVEQGSREAALEEIEKVGKFSQKKDNGLNAEDRRNLRDAARDQLIALLAWTDLHKEKPLLENLGQSRAALDSSHELCVLGFPGDGRVEVRDTVTKEVLKERKGKGEAIEGPLYFGPDEDTVAMGFGEASNWKLVLWNWRKDTEVVIDGVQGVDDAFDFHPDENEGFAIGTTGGKNTLELFAMNGERRGDPIELPGRPVVIRFSPDGEHMAIGMEAAGLIIKEIATGKTVDERDELVVTSLAWSRDGRAVAVGELDGSVAILKRGSLGDPFPVKHKGRVVRLAWSRDGRHLGSGSEDGEVFLWDARQETLLSKYSAWAHSFRFSKDDKFLGPVLNMPDTLSRLEIQPHPTEVCHRVAGHPGFDVHAAVWSADETVLATAAGDGLRLWNREGLELAHFPEDRVSPGGLTRSTNFLYLADSVRIWRRAISISDGRLVCGEAEPIRVDIHGAEQIQLSPDGKILGVACAKEVVFLDPVSGDILRRLEAPPSTAFLAFSPDGNWLATGTRKGRTVRVWELNAKKGFPPTDIEVAGAATVAFFPLPAYRNEKEELISIPPLLMTGDEEAYRLWSWNKAKGGWMEVRKHGSKMKNPNKRMARMAFSPRGTVVVTSYDLKSLQILNPQILLPLHDGSMAFDVMTEPGFDQQWPLNISPDGRLLVTESADKGRIFIWNLEKARVALVKCKLYWDGLPIWKEDPPDVVKPPIEAQ